jgi:hypothetical protein
MLRIICNVLSVSVSLSDDKPFIMPSTKPIPPPIAKPTSARQALTSMLAHSSPDRAIRQNASATANGAGNTLL